ncbi:hypothetical protein SVIO_005350 [Streptomyces violaceusniger]|uniref:NAD-dependent epimerase/dehydratase domain-containing protein n=1 Tax=Streptomyces violaceusniger TaxID=68280 RepID=A0A4D4KMP6_STRVO|nr:hypothetical protein SVIO_005350 [Streptomyces violaceusniger]
MRVFVTGATGFIGAAVVRELLDAGHQVLGLARSDASAAALTATGAEVHRGTLEDLDSLRAGAASADGVIHTAFIHDFSDFHTSVAVDLRAVETIAQALAGTDRPLVISSGTPGVAGGTATEDTIPAPGTPAAARGGAEEAVLAFADRGVHGSVVRLPRSVHGEGDRHGFVPRLIDIARERGCRRIRAMGQTRGRPCTGWTPRCCTGWPWSRRPRAACCTRWAMRASRCARSPSASAAI